MQDNLDNEGGQRAHQLHTLLHETKLKDVVKTRPIITFSHDMPIGKVLETLSKHRILSGPVMMHQPNAPPESSIQCLLGFVDVMSILDAFLQVVGYEPHGQLPSAEQLEAAGLKLCSQPVLSLFGDHVTPHQTSTVLTGSDRCRDFGIRGDLTTSLYDVIRHGFIHTPQPLGPPPPPCFRSRHCVHRIAVFDTRPPAGTATAAGPGGSSAALLDVLSQSDVTRWLSAHLSSLGPMAHKTLAELGLASARLQLVGGSPRAGSKPSTPASPSAAGRSTRHLLAVAQDIPALEGFRILLHEHVSGLAVVAGTSAAGATLCGNLSASDLRCLAPGLFSSLLLPLSDFLQQRPLLAAVQQETAEALTPPGGTPVPQPTAAAAAAVPADSSTPFSSTATAAPARDAAATPAVAAPAPPAAAPAPPSSSSSLFGAVAEVEEFSQEVAAVLGSRTLLGRVVTCQATSTLGELLLLYRRSQVHRVYAVDPDQRPVGVVTMTDVLHLVMGPAAAAAGAAGGGGGG